MVNRTQTWLIAFIFVGAAAFAETNMNNGTNRTPSGQGNKMPKDQSNEINGSAPVMENRGHEMTKEQMIPIYSAPARIDVRSSWDLYVTGKFLYWQAREENLEIGLISRNDAEGLFGSTMPFATPYVNNMHIVNQQFTYRPGFKVGLGANLDNDNWDAYAEYTWFHSSTTGRVNPLPPSTATTPPPNGEYLYPIQGAAAAMKLQIGTLPYFFQSATQSWHLKMDFADLSLARSYYSGTNLILRPYFGVRGAWIRQHLNTAMNGNATSSEAEGRENASLHDSSVSWGVGPRLGFEGNWQIGQGIRLIGNGSSDILYTRYSLHSNQQFSQHSTLPGEPPIRTNASLSQMIDYLRAHAELELGFGWGSYFDNNKWHIDLAATYGFQLFWDQNMFRNFENFFMETKSFSPNGNLYIHGMTVSANLDF